MSEPIASVRKTRPWAAVVLAFFAASIAGYGIVSYLTGHPLDAGFLQGKAHYQGFTPSVTWTAALVVHVAGGSLALLAGAFQWVTLRSRRFHVVTGLLYVGGIAAGAVAGLFLAVDAMGGAVSAWGFGMLDALWVATTARAAFLGLALRRTTGSERVEVRRRHRAWMIRSYALTAAAITLRLWLPLLTVAAGFDFVAAYTVIAWLCWVPNLVAAEVLIRHR